MANGRVARSAGDYALSAAVDCSDQKLSNPGGRPANEWLKGTVATLRDPTFMSMWIAMFVSTVGSSTLLLALSTRIYLDTRSTFNASLVYGAQWLLPIFLAPLTVRIYAVVSPRTALITSEAMGVTLAVVIGWGAGMGFSVLLPLLILRGLIDILVKSSRLVALKASFSGDRLKRAATLNTTPYILGLATAALLASVLVPQFTLLQISILSSVCFAIASLFYCTLAGGAASTPPASDAGPKMSDVFTTFREDPSLARHFGLRFAVASIMQGYHAIARTVLPIEHLGLGPQGPAWFQAISICGVLAGATLASAAVGTRPYERTRSELLALAGYLLLVAPLLPIPLSGSLSLYFLFMLVFELTSVRLTGDILATCKKEHAPSISVAITTTGLLGTTIVALGGGWAAESLGLQGVAIGLAAIGLLTTAWFARMTGRPALLQLLRQRI